MTIHETRLSWYDDKAQQGNVASIGNTRDIYIKRITYFDGRTDYRNVRTHLMSCATYSTLFIRLLTVYKSDTDGRTDQGRYPVIEMREGI